MAPRASRATSRHWRRSSWRPSDCSSVPKKQLLRLAFTKRAALLCQLPSGLVTVHVGLIERSSLLPHRIPSRSCIHRSNVAESSGFLFVVGPLISDKKVYLGAVVVYFNSNSLCFNSNHYNKGNRIPPNKSAFSVHENPEGWRAGGRALAHANEQMDHFHWLSVSVAISALRHRE